MLWDELPAGQVKAALEKIAESWGDHADTFVERINSDPFFAERMANYGKDKLGIFDLTEAAAKAKSALAQDSFMRHLNQARPVARN